jgi:hypothetical protein
MQERLRRWWRRLWAPAAVYVLCGPHGEVISVCQSNLTLDDMQMHADEALWLTGRPVHRLRMNHGTRRALLPIMAGDDVANLVPIEVVREIPPGVVVMETR